jgi:hypothetical protein
MFSSTVAAQAGLDETRVFVLLKKPGDKDDECSALEQQVVPQRTFRQR